MKNEEIEELEKTKPIEVLSELSRSTKYEEKATETREEKYHDSVEKEELKEAEEEAEEALAEKNIAEAEALLDKEKSEKLEPVIPELVVKDEKVGLFKKIKNKWNKLDKKKRILLIVIGILLVILIGILIAFLVINNKEVPKNDEKTKEVIPEEAPIITDNFYYRDGKLYFTNEKEEVLGNYECENKDSNLCYVAYNNDRDNFDVPKLQDEAGREKTKRLQIYEDRYAFIVDNKDSNDKKIKMFSMTDGKLVGTYNTVKAYSDNYIIVEDETNNFGLLKIDDGVIEVIKPQYSYLGMIDGEENLIAKNKKGYVVIDKTNKILSEAVPSSATIKSYNNSMIVASINNEYNVYDYKANLIAGGYVYASVKDTYAALVDSNKKLTIRGVDKTKYNESNVSLESTNYVKTYVYDSDDNVKKVKRSYELNVKDNAIEVAVYDNDGEVTYENLEFVYALANKKYSYVNYFNGKLYFYKDAEKEELIGSYTCSNKNYIEKDSDTYESCFVAKDKVYEDNDMMHYSDVNRKASAPIINNTYVFVSDGTNNVKLYDLIQNKSISSYNSVNTYTVNNDYAITSFQGTIEVVAVSKKSGKYGVVLFDQKGVSSKITFDYNSIEKIGKNYLISEDGIEYQLKYSDGGESPKFNGKIMGYTSDLKHFKILNNKKYSVGNSDGKIEVSNGFNYVELYSDYFAGVNDKKELYLYDYAGNKISDEKVMVMDYPFSKTENPAFKVSKEGKTYIVSVYNGSSYEKHEIKAGVKPEVPVESETEE